MASVEPSGVVSLLTDFGTQDPFVGVMKGAIYSRFRDARVVDLTHEIAPQDLVTAAFWIHASFRYFPEGTVHVVVVDPGVGTSRKPLLVSADRHHFLAPDNGVLSLVVSKAADVEIRQLDVSLLGGEPISATFHGRDVFAPAAGELASGYRWPPELGRLLDDHVKLELPRPIVSEGRIEGEVLTVDRFGNLITNIGNKRLERLSSPRIGVGDQALTLSKTYADRSEGELVALINAFSMLEIAMVNGSAASRLGLGKGAPVLVESD